MKKKTPFLKNLYKEEYENTFVAVHIHAHIIFDSDISFQRLYKSIPLVKMDEVMFFFVKEKNFNLIDQDSIDIYVRR